VSDINRFYASAQNRAKTDLTHRHPDEYRRLYEEAIEALGGRPEPQPRRPRQKGPRPPCGTDTAYQRHRIVGEPTDAACRAAHAASMKAYRSKATSG
jgi:hypothetical protein